MIHGAETKAYTQHSHIFQLIIVVRHCPFTPAQKNPLVPNDPACLTVIQVTPAAYTVYPPFARRQEYINLLIARGPAPRCSCSAKPAGKGESIMTARRKRLGELVIRSEAPEALVEFYRDVIA